MSTDGNDASDAAAGDGAGEVKKKRGCGKLILVIVAAAVLLLGGGGAAAFFLGVFGGDAAEGRAEGTGPAGPVAPIFHDLPDLVVTLNAGERRSRYLKAHVVLELAQAADQPRIELLTPRILDYCQMFLRELRPEELRGSAAMVRMREELLKRINAAVAPVVVRDVLFSDVLVE